MFKEQKFKKTQVNKQNMNKKRYNSINLNLSVFTWLDGEIDVFDRRIFSILVQQFPEVRVERHELDAL